jgi:hypothetical protein
VERQELTWVRVVLTGRSKVLAKASFADTFPVVEDLPRQSVENLPEPENHPR